MREKNLTEQQLAELFQKTSEKISKFLLVLLIPFTALCTWPISFRKRKYFFDQLVFATEVNCMYLIWGFLMLPLLFKSFDWLYIYFSGSHLSISDNFTGLFIGIPLIIYVGLAAYRFYHFTKLQSILFALFFLIVHTFIVHYLYKFILFVVVINQIH